MISITLVIPCFNEESGLPALFKRLDFLKDQKDFITELLFVDDGSSDATASLLLEYLKNWPLWKVIRLSRNFGLNSALRCGLEHARGQAVVFLDADCQDPPEKIPQMVQKWQEGMDVVIGVRISRSETGLKRICLNAFHKIFHKITGGVMPAQSGTFGLMSRRAVEAVLAMPESNSFLPAQRCWVGFRKDVVTYDRSDREGEAKQSFAKLFAYAWDGITSFSDMPLRWISLAGVFIAGFSFVVGCTLILYRVSQYFGYFQDQEVLGFTTLAVSIFFMGGIQLICVGLLGEYIARIYQEVKRRPSYIVAEQESSLNSP